MGNKLFLEGFIRNATAFCALCKNEAEDIKRFYPKAKVFIVPNGVDINIYKPALTNYSNERMVGRELVGEKCVIFGFMGRIDVYHKGIDILLSALKIIQETTFIKIKLILIGPFYTKKDEEKTKTFIQQLKEPSDVILTGRKQGEEKLKILSFFDIFIHTSRFEGLPSAVLEAMALGKPCIVTPGTNMQEIISVCNGGWLCDESSESIAQAIQLAVDDRGEILKRGDNARIYVKNNFTWSIIAQQYTKNLKQVLDYKLL